MNIYLVGRTGKDAKGGTILKEITAAFLEKKHAEALILGQPGMIVIAVLITDWRSALDGAMKSISEPESLPLPF